MGAYNNTILIKMVTQSVTWSVYDNFEDNIYFFSFVYENMVIY